MLIINWSITYCDVTSKSKKYSTYSILSNLHCIEVWDTYSNDRKVICPCVVYRPGYDYPDLPGLGNNNEKLGLPERLSTEIQFRFRNLFHGKKKSGNRNFIC
jgi:hypothetical protein